MVPSLDRPTTTLFLRYNMDFADVCVLFEVRFHLIASLANSVPKRKMELKSQSGMLQCSTATFDGSCGCSGCKLQDMPEWRKMTEQTDWRAKEPSINATILRMAYV